MKVLLVAMVLLTVACGSSAGTASTSPSAVGTAEQTPLARPSGHMDAEVSMPDGFPADMPIYAKARLTAGAAFRSTGQVSWGMEWQTLDTVAKVRAFYAAKLNAGDWSIAFGTAPSGTFSATFTRKSNSQVQGTLSSSRINGVTKITMTLAAPG